MANERDAFLREIEEQVRREQLAKLWDKHGVAILGALAGLILLYIGWNWYESSQREAAAKAGAQFGEVTKFIAEGKHDDGIRGFEQISAEGPSGYSQLAQLRLAANARRNGKNEEALRHYEKLSSSAAADRIIRDFAKLQLATLNLDSDNWTTTKNRLDDLLQEDNPWKYAAREVLGLAAYRAGQLQEAEKAFTQLLASSYTPQSMRRRAQLVMALVTRDDAVARTNQEPAAGKQQGDSQEVKKTGEAKTP